MTPCQVWIQASVPYVPCSKLFHDELEVLRNAANVGEKYPMTVSLFSAFRAVKGMEEHLSYKGSLTTPPCTEAITWIIYPFAVKVSRDEVRAPRSCQTCGTFGVEFVCAYRWTSSRASRRATALRWPPSTARSSPQTEGRSSGTRSREIMETTTTLGSPHTVGEWEITYY